MVSNGLVLIVFLSGKHTATSEPISTSVATVTGDPKLWASAYRQMSKSIFRTQFHRDDWICRNGFHCVWVCGSDKCTNAHCVAIDIKLNSGHLRDCRSALVVSTLLCVYSPSSDSSHRWDQHNVLCIVCRTGLSCGYVCDTMDMVQVSGVSHTRVPTADTHLDVLNTGIPSNVPVLSPIGWMYAQNAFLRSSSGR